MWNRAYFNSFGTHLKHGVGVHYTHGKDYNLFFSEDCVPAQGYSIFISRYCTFQPSMELAPSWVKTIYYVEQTSDIIFGKLCECWC